MLWIQCLFCKTRTDDQAQVGGNLQKQYSSQPLHINVMEVWSVTATWSQGWTLPEKKTFLALVCPGRISFSGFISFKCFAGNSWSCLGVRDGHLLKIHFSWVLEIYVATKEINVSAADCTPTYLKCCSVVRADFCSSRIHLTTPWLPYTQKLPCFYCSGINSYGKKCSIHS